MPKKFFGLGKKAAEMKNNEVINMLDSAYMEETAEETAKPVRPELEAVRHKRNTVHFFIGLFVLVMSVIGIISTVGFISGQVRRIIDNTDEKTKFARFIYPVVICDPPAFDQTAMLKNETLISAGIWDIILYEDKSKYNLDFDYIIVPEVDVEQHAAKLFGTGLSFDHKTISTADFAFYYDDEINSYRIPENPKYFSYSPYVEEIKQVGESYTLTVGYVSPTPAWLSITSEDTPLPEKYVDYVVQKRGESYTLVSIRSSDKKAVSEHENGL